jgi:hypothetical protein
MEMGLGLVSKKKEHSGGTPSIQSVHMLAVPQVVFKSRMNTNRYENKHENRLTDTISMTGMCH